MASPRSRVFRTSNKATAGIYLQDNSVSMIGNEKNFIRVDESGIVIKGPLSIMTDAMGRRTGGLFVGLSDWLEMIPSTIVTPIPQTIPLPPIFSLINIAKDVSFFASLLV